MPVDPGAESPDHVSDPAPPPAVTVDADTVVAAVLAALVEPLADRIAEGIAYDRHTKRHGGALLPAAERAQQIASSALSDAEFALRQAGNRPTRGRRLIEQHAARVAERVLRSFLKSLEVADERVDSAAAMLHNEFADHDHWAAAAQLSAAKEKVDPEPLQPRPFPDAGEAQA